MFHSFSSLSYDRSKPLPKRALHILQSKASSFKWEFPVLSWRSSSSFLHHLPFTSIPPLIFPSIVCCSRQFMLKTLTCFSHDQSNWSSPSSSTTFQNFPGVPDLQPETSKFQHHMKLRSKCSILLVVHITINITAVITTFFGWSTNKIYYETAVQFQLP
jgi:hypothetical protein